MRGPRHTLAALALALAAVAALPLVAVFARAVAPGAGDTWSHLAQTVLPDYLANTLLLVVLVGAGAGIGGTATAWLIAQRRFPGSRIFGWALLLPLAMPAYVMAYAYTDALQYAGPVQTALREAFGWSRDDYRFPEVRSVGGAAVMFVFTLYPYVYLLARTAFLERPPALVEAARTLGLDRRGAFWHVEVPLARPAIAGGIALVLMETLADYGTVAYFAVDTFTTGIYRAWFSLGDRAAAAQLAIALLGFVVLALALERMSRKAARMSGSTRGRTVAPTVAPQLTGTRAWFATIVCVVPLAVGFLIPVLLLVRLFLADPGAVDTGRFATWAWNSLRVSTIAAVLAVALAVLVAYAVRIAPSPATRGTGTNPGLVLTGTVFALVYAYLVRYFAVAWNGIEPGLARITPAMDAAARSLGAGTLETLRRVHVPLLARSGAAAFLLVFVDVMKELPATLVMRPFNFDTLATQTYLFARDERLAEAALPSLAIVAVGLVPILFLARASRRVARG
jgi:iron(III) transport system permease protein